MLICAAGLLWALLGPALWTAAQERVVQLLPDSRCLR